MAGVGTERARQTLVIDIMMNQQAPEFIIPRHSWDQPEPFSTLLMLYFNDRFSRTPLAV